MVVSGAETQAVLDELSNEIDRLNKENAALRQRVQLLTHRLFGRRCEKGAPVAEQGVLAFEAAAAGQVRLETTDKSHGTRPPNAHRCGGAIPGRCRLPVYLRDVTERVSTHLARLVPELTPREWKCLRRDSGAQAAT